MLDKEKIKRVNMHLIEDEDAFQDLGWSSKLNTEWEFLTHLFEKGRASADAWIKENYDNVGKKTTAPMNDNFVGGSFGKTKSQKLIGRKKTCTELKIPCMTQETSKVKRSLN